MKPAAAKHADTVMRYFTPELYLRYNSKDADEATAADVIVVSGRPAKVALVHDSGAAVAVLASAHETRTASRTALR